ncbi:g6241 [Coccomyxa viridis]|uniref:G6241 protein n=1 Tax=Coccomyxa viridis TaxID=1274662 RepID=A0ABP1FUW3_9CHLO
MLPQLSRRVRATDAPIIVKTKQFIGSRQDVLSLAQGIVHWTPPAGALDLATEVIRDKGVSAYGPCAGLPALASALREKLATENGLPGHEVMVTSGANQAFTNLVLTLLDPSDAAVLFVPYYFNHLMALQMTGGGHSVVHGRCDPHTWQPDLDWLEQTLSGPDPPKMVVLVNPCNPTGVLLSREALERAAQLTARAGAWLVMDNTYEHFVYEGLQHHCISAPHIIHLFSFSKAFGMMGWRVGYIAYQDSGGLGAELAKVQDTIPICPPQLSQYVALGALQAGRPWVASQLDSIMGNRGTIIDALSPLGAMGSGVAGGEGAIYLWAKLPEGCEDDEAVVEWLVREHGVCVIPGSACGAAGYIRAAYANLQPEACREAGQRLKQGLQQLVAEGMAALEAVPLTGAVK